MGTEIARMGPQAVPVIQPIEAGTMEKVLLMGDLSKLDSAERVRYYGSLCQTLGLNPLTRPFEYLQLNGKLQLYAKKECTEQLRMKYDVSVQIVGREVVEGCYIVTARATMAHGRADESIGAVNIENLKGEARSNAMMKAETKAKRRVTLSICGLAFLDDMEVDSVPGAYPVPVDVSTGEMPTPQAGATLHDDIVAHPPKETKAQRKSSTPFDALRAFGDLKKRYQKVCAEPAYYAVLGQFGKSKSNEFTPQEINDARACYKQMSIEVADLEAAWAQITEVESLPDPIEHNIGKRLRCADCVYEVEDRGENGHKWRELK